MPVTGSSAQHAEDHIGNEIASSSIAAILSWNRKVKADTAKNPKSRKYIRAYIYPLSGDYPRIVCLPVISDFDPGVPIWTNDLRVREWFPFGNHETTITSLPLGDESYDGDGPFFLKNTYIMLTSLNPHESPSNECICRLWGNNVAGNVVVVRHGRGAVPNVTHMSAPELQLVDYLVALNTKHILQDTQANDTDTLVAGL
ncbi:hypothetical protein GSI_12240 [Ganoderma sinense ZZ0214-1]|uniref:Uncharacterized protein n=1 Tax=Ganoderma sinense ZZ0214-1 TaxID=1077348 RepID=A0A2G8RY94_9APHY|nr:hypothetical protein GSI_12240 [Ganoderma sinense ZZ0214-1]